MPTIIGPAAAPTFAPVLVPRVQVKAHWADEWRDAPDLEMMEATVCAAGHDMDRCVVRRRYGPSLKHPWESSLAAVTPISLRHWWLRVLLPAGRSEQQIWIGRVRGEGRDVQGAALGPTGLQKFVAYGPLDLLRRTGISRAFVARTISEGTYSRVEIGWMPGINDGGLDGAVVGNRSIAEVEGSYLYDDDAPQEGDEPRTPDVWTYRQYLRYLIAQFLNADDDEPQWSLSGQDALLDALTQPIALDDQTTADALIRRLIPIESGLDYRIRSTEEGFSIHVFSLCAQSYSFGGRTLAANPQRVPFVAGERHDSPRTTLAEDDCHQYGTIRVLGERLVVCCSLLGPEWTEGQAANTLRPGWGTDDDDREQMESDYSNPPGLDDPDEILAYRRQDRFRDLWAKFAAPADWDHHAGLAAPTLQSDGTLSDEPGNYQNRYRETLDWLPLYEGYDYSNGQQLRTASAAAKPELMRPLVLLTEYDAETMEGAAIYVRAEDDGVNVSILPGDWGVLLETEPRHRLAAGIFDEVYDGPEFGSGGVDFNWRWTIVTLAFRSDERLGLEVALDNGVDGVLEIRVPGAECWYLAPNTVVGLDEDGMYTVSGAKRLLRNDTERLAQEMAGALARYSASRARADIAIKGLRAWGDLVGQILGTVQAGGDVAQLEAPITQVRWQGQETIISTGFAL